MNKLLVVAILFGILTIASAPGSASIESNRSAAELTPDTPSPSDDPHLVFFKRAVLNTRSLSGIDPALQRLTLHEFDPKALARKHTSVIHFSGAIKPAWVRQLKAAGAQIIGYVPNNSYIIRADSAAFARVSTLVGADAQRPIKWIGALAPLLKIDPSFDESYLAAVDGEYSTVEIELLDSEESREAIEFINAGAISINSAPRRFSGFIVLSVTIPANRLLEVARFGEVLFIKQVQPMTLHDERSAQIVAGNLSADGGQPLGPGYFDWLDSKGLANSTDCVIDIADSGIDRGLFSSIHPDFLDAGGKSRLVYINDFSEEGLTEDRRGHGTLVASIAAGGRTGGLTDSENYLLGLGIAPAARIGSSRIFRANGSLPYMLSFTEVVSAAYEGGARVSNNSWGRGGNDYDSACQEYDALVRDARPGVDGLQQMTIVFSAGNSGPGGRISAPGTAKNVITVAASENYRPEALDSCDLDGEGGVGPDGADNIQDILRFSSGGPTVDGRRKPDISAPGTHVEGAASQSPRFFGDGLCPGILVFQPPGQSLYTWSSGTSMATPQVSGAAALLHHFLRSKGLVAAGAEPSPALIKAFLINSASYLTGENAGGNLPANRQGWGLVNLGAAFENTRRVVIDQTNLFSESGQSFEVKGSIADRAGPLRITLVWTDAPGTLAGAPWVNNLDLEVVIGDQVYRGNNFAGAFSISGGSFDGRNNVECVFLQSGVVPEGFEGNFTVRVRAANIAGDGVPGNGIDLDQDFALVISNAAPPLPAPVFPAITAATYEAKTLTITGKDFTASARVEINGKLIERTFAFDPARTSLAVNAKRRKLNLVAGADNQIVIIESGRRSELFVLRL